MSASLTTSNLPNPKLRSASSMRARSSLRRAPARPIWTATISDFRTLASEHARSGVSNCCRRDCDADAQRIRRPGIAFTQQIVPLVQHDRPRFSAATVNPRYDLPRPKPPGQQIGCSFSVVTMTGRLRLSNISSVRVQLLRLLIILGNGNV